MRKKKSVKVNEQAKRLWEEEMTLLFLQEHAEKDCKIRKEISAEIYAKLDEHGISRRTFTTRILCRTYDRMIKSGGVNPKLIPQQSESGSWDRRYFHLFRQDGLNKPILPFADNLIDEMLKDIERGGRDHSPSPTATGKEEEKA